MNRAAFDMAMRDLRADPLDEALRLITADLIEEISNAANDLALASELRAGLIPVTPLDCRTIKALYGCRFLPGSYEKRFVQDVYFDVPVLKNILTPRQFRYLWVLAWKFRRQIQDPQVTDEARLVQEIRTGRPAGDSQPGPLEPLLPFD